MKLELPNYFLADLPKSAELTPTLLREAAQTLKRNRQQFLAGRSTADMIQLLVRVAENWLNPGDPFRRRALAEGPAATGFSEEVLRAGLDDFFSGVTEKALCALVLQDLGDLERLDFFIAPETGRRETVSALAHGPELLVHIAGGALPNPVFTSMILGVLLRSAQFVKCAAGTAFLPRLFAHSLYAADRKLGACLELAEWKGGSRRLEEALFAEVGCVTATGSDETLDAIRNRLPAGVRFIGYGHRVSFGYVTKESLSLGVADLVRAAARDVAAWDQQGCLSPQVIWAERGGQVSPEQFAEMLSRELEELERSHPRGKLGADEAAAIASRRSFYEVRAAHSPETRMWRSEGSTAWTVVFEQDPVFQSSCLNRFIFVKSTTGLAETLAGAEGIRGKVSAVGLAAPSSRMRELTLELARWGVTRICPLGRMQRPPLTWRHDGRPALGDLVCWTEWEQGKG